jgi:branched-chain amino acid transport system permease protein
VSELLATVWSGVILGSLYALMSIGLTLIWGGLRLLNLTLGAVYMFGAYTALLTGTLGLPPPLGLLASFLAMGVLGVILYVGPLQLLSARPDRENAIILTTFGLAVVLENIALLTFGPRSQDIPRLVSGNTIIGGVVMTWNALAITAVAVVLLAAIAVALKWTRLGIAIRALAQDRDGAQLAGISVHRTSALVMFLSSGLGGVAGTLLSSYYFVSPYVGDNYLLTALIVTILGGLGSVVGTLLAAYLVGLLQALVSLYMGVRWSLPVLFGLIILTLIVRPGGIAGRVAKERL